MVLLIGGHIRSEMTLLRNLCNSHPEVALTNEFDNFSDLGRAYTQHSRRLLRKLWRKTIKNRQVRLEWYWSNYAFVSRYLFKRKDQLKLAHTLK